MFHSPSLALVLIHSIGPAHEADMKLHEHDKRGEDDFMGLYPHDKQKRGEDDLMGLYPHDKEKRGEDDVTVLYEYDHRSFNADFADK